MKISIIIATNRLGGLDITFNGLGKQTFDISEWELIVIDDFIYDRKEECISYCKKYDLKNFIYLRPKKNYWRSNTLIANPRNTGLIHAKGELILFIDDYTWTPPKLLENHWSNYKDGYCLVGKTNVVIYAPDQIDNIDKLPPPIVDENTKLDVFEGCSAYMKNISRFKIADTRGIQDVKDCGGGWFYTSNASAPLNKIIEVNGFDEEFDLTREVDIGLGLMLERVGIKFYYKTCNDCIVHHMDHIPVEEMMRKANLKRYRYKNITYEELRKREVLESNPDEIQLVLKEKYGTLHDGSWGLQEKRRRDGISYANIVDNIKIFDLKEERIKIGNWI